MYMVESRSMLDCFLMSRSWYALRWDVTALTDSMNPMAGSPGISSLRMSSMVRMILTSFSLTSMGTLSSYTVLGILREAILSQISRTLLASLLPNSMWSMSTLEQKTSQSGASILSVRSIHACS